MEKTNPYRQAMEQIKKDPESRRSEGFAKLIMSLGASGYGPFGLGECLNLIGDPGNSVAQEMIDNFLRYGEDIPDEAKKEIYELYPEVMEEAEAAYQAKTVYKLERHSARLKKERRARG